MKVRTQDLGGYATTQDFTAAVVKVSICFSHLIVRGAEKWWLVVKKTANSDWEPFSGNTPRGMYESSHKSNLSLQILHLFQIIVQQNHGTDTMFGVSPSWIYQATTCNCKDFQCTYILFYFDPRFFKNSLEFTLFFRNPQLFLGTVKCSWEPWGTLSNPQGLPGIWHELQLEPKQMKSNDWSIYFRKIDRMVEVWIKIWKITRDEMWRRYHKSWANLNAGSFLQHQISPTGLPENRLNSILNDHIQMICLCKYTTAIALIP